MLLVVSGLPGTGKTTVADLVASRRGAVRVSVDPLEEALREAGLPASREIGVAAYAAGGAVAALNLANGLDVVVDAVNDSEAARDVWRSAAARAGAEVHFVVLSLDDAVEHRRRLEERRTHLVHVTLPTYEQVVVRAAASEAWTGEFVRVDGAASAGEVADQVLSVLRDR